ncbi:hypothetical protein E5676_scaffold606G001840 [Cucumis melo var. makuwa]|uniref:Uncharacterized protein n=1 Tax=Cucumis melo var. makuwa TaxID=1194695 RepID=A0A5D3C7R8_CUCMM|nr:hypothetical protein E6C27_scaffold132G00500 [Cucumis melo var. makuwa]TYK07284.1 hypothetical protein E5676_scaffold606G001840 [Cucumis melo var. makuwa]
MILVRAIPRSVKEEFSGQALVVREMLLSRWWSVTLQSKYVNKARRCWISQVTRLILARANHRLSSNEAMRRLVLRLRCQIKEERQN